MKQETKPELICWGKPWEHCRAKEAESGQVCNKTKSNVESQESELGRPHPYKQPEEHWGKHKGNHLTHGHDRENHTYSDVENFYFWSIFTWKINSMSLT